MRYLSDLAKGALIGAANVIPGVSGGTMAVSLGIYDKLIFAVTDLLGNWRKSLKTLLPILLGAGLGITGFTYAVEFLFRSYPLPTVMAFLGLIGGGVPTVWRSYRASLAARKGRAFHGDVAVFLLALGSAGLLPLLHGPAQTTAEFGLGIGSLALLLVLGMVAAATMVVPGVSGSMVLLILGYYYAVIELLKRFFDAVAAGNLSAAILAGIPAACFGVGALLGIFIVAKSIRHLLEKRAAETYSGILGLVAASPVAMLHNTGILQGLSFPDDGWQMAAGVLLLAGCFFAIWRPVSTRS